MESNQDDPVIDEIREIRHRISAKFDHDPAKVVAYYIQLQEQYRDRLIGSVKARQPSEEQKP
jgi:hypothetical protein